MLYKEIISKISGYINLSNDTVKDLLYKNHSGFEEVLYSFFVKGKKLRSALIFLTLKALNNEINEKHINLAVAVELMHNASLIHDDIIDNAQTRREEKTFNEKYGNSISVILGDYLFSLSTEFINLIGNQYITKMFSNTMKTMCSGEIYQYFYKGKICSIENYIEKSYKKTGKLFETAISSALILSGKENILNEFAKNFGIAFQIRDDYNNIYNDDSNIDIKEKIYTAPVIFAQEDYPELLEYSEEKIIEIVKNKKYREKTENLIKKYTKNAIENLNILQDNEFKIALIDLCKHIEMR